MKNFDVIVLGSGSIGTPTALYLAEAGMKVLVLDKFASPGQGSNKAAIGGIRATHSDPAKISLCLRSLDIFSHWEEQRGDPIEWVQGGYSFVAYTPREEKILKDLLVIQKRYGLNINWLEKDQLLQVIPALNHDSLIGGTYSPEDGSASSLLAVQAFYRHARKAGAIFHFHETVTGIGIENGKVSHVKTDKDTYFAPFVINAAGAWAAEIGKFAGLSIPVMPDSHEAGVTEPIAHFLDPMVVDIRPGPNSSNYYFYQHATGQIIFCITPHPAIYGTDCRETSIFLPQIAQRMIGIMPRLRYLKVRHTWRGLYPMTPDGSPIVGIEPTLQGYIHAEGMCGQGFMLGPGIGQLLTRLVQNSLTENDREVLQILRPNRTGNQVQEKLA